jgi:hypothetical protein
VLGCPEKMMKIFLFFDISGKNTMIFAHQELEVEKH